MKLTELFKRPASLINILLEIWEKSVRETHLFLPESEIQNIKQNFLPGALKNITHLIIAQDDERPIAFIGIEGQKLEMLFVTPEYRGKGVGRKMIEYAIKHFSINELTVNEQNPQAKEFYEHLGFKIYKRSEIDEQGNPYPILYMKLLNS